MFLEEEFDEISRIVYIKPTEDKNFMSESQLIKDLLAFHSEYFSGKEGYHVKNKKILLKESVLSLLGLILFPLLNVLSFCMNSIVFFMQI